MRPAAFLFTVVLIVSTAIGCHAFVPASSSVSSSFGRPVTVGRSQRHDKAGIFLAKDNDTNGKDQSSNKPTMTKGTRPSITPLFDNFNRAIWAFGILFIVSAFVLESFGYSYVVVDNHLEINTLEFRQFQNEIVKVAKEAKSLSNSI
jgi:hypothetical protein